MKYLLIFVYSTFALAVSAQCNSSISFSEKEKESFVRVYLGLKKDKPKQEDLLYKIAEKHNITHKQFSEIQHEREVHSKLTSDENAFIAELDQLRKANEEQLNSERNIKCAQHKISISQYDIILNQYRSCIKFQRSLSDYFKKWMK